MPWLKKHNVLRKQLKEQGLYVRGKTFVEQVTTFYERRIATALSTPDTGEKYAALLNIRDEMQSYVSENNRLLKTKAEIASAEEKTPRAIGAVTIFAMTVTTVAFCVALGGLTPLLTEFTLGMAGVGELLAVAGVITLATDKPQPDHFKKLATDENAALNGLSARIKKEMLSLAEQAHAQVFFSPRANPLTRLEKLKMRFVGASQDVPYQQVIVADNDGVPQEKLHVISR